MDNLADRILLDLVHQWEECLYRDCISGWTVCFRRSLYALLYLSDNGYIRQTSSAGNTWSILPTTKGIAYAKTLTRKDWRHTIADLNS